KNQIFTFVCESLSSLISDDEDQKIRLVIQRLGLNSIAPFIPKERIIEYIIREREGQDD
ncbi:unnamed protein product, partial [Rotaria sp. Silwood1]